MVDIEKLFKLSELISLPGCNFNYHEGEDYSCELKKLLCNFEELRELLFNILLQECSSPNNCVDAGSIRLYQEAVEYFKEIGWVSPAGQIWKEIEV